MSDGINYTGDLPLYVLDRLFDNLMDKSYWNVDDRNNVNNIMLQIITLEAKLKFQLTIAVFSIAFVMSVIENFFRTIVIINYAFYLILLPTFLIT